LETRALQDPAREQTTAAPSVLLGQTPDSGGGFFGRVTQGVREAISCARRDTSTDWRRFRWPAMSAMGRKRTLR